MRRGGGAPWTPEPGARSLARSLAGRAGRGCDQGGCRRHRRRTSPGGYCHRSAPAGSELAALGPLRSLQTASSLFPFLFYRRRRVGGDFHPGTFQSRDAGPGAESRGSPAARGRRARRGRGTRWRGSWRRRRAAPRPAPLRPAPSRPPREKLLRPAPGCPRVSHLGISEAGSRHIHVEIAVMGTGNEIGSFFLSRFSAENHQLWRTRREIRKKTLKTTPASGTAGFGPGLKRRGCARDELVGERRALGPGGDFENKKRSRPSVPTPAFLPPGPHAGGMQI
ncbi:uncharacterized protein LOC131514936 [Neofelis nebulosa]|uniref:uncharacterized protein LOC131514936 n=1 Tax=Neofelis nebulosa TaxID=61452 RepID=UPI00272D6084|nr:uncharacterized protein LOC131514936 [Neofelis nebulosa]